ncbi:MAG: hypothetical protein RIC03_12540 [Cyclobacteriaceae bacterium]
MRLLINKNDEGSSEIQALTGSFYESNEFSKIKTDWLLAQEEIESLVGSAVINRALDHYESNAYLSESSSTDIAINDELVEYLQMPMAYLATIRFYESNLVSHEDTGRKVKIDADNEKMAWEWMLDRDDAAQLRKANSTQDRLLKFLEANNIAEWLDSDKRKMSRKLFINSAQLFQEAYPIDLSTRFFYTVTPFIQEVQNRVIKKALGAKYAPLLEYWMNFNQLEGSSSNGGLPGDESSPELDELLEMVQLVMPLLTMVIAVKRLALQVLPEGVVQNFKSMGEARSASQPALQEIIKIHCEILNEDAKYTLDDIKVHLHAADPEALEYQLLPENSAENKFFRT